MKRWVLWSSAGIGAIIIGAGIPISLHYHTAHTDLQDAQYDLRRNRLSAASTALTAAQQAWPFVIVAPIRSQISRAQQVNANFEQGVNALDQGHWHEARQYFSAIPAWSAHAAGANHWLNRLNTAEADASIATAVLRQGTTINQDINQFWTDSNGLGTTLNQLKSTLNAFSSFFYPSSASSGPSSSTLLTTGTNQMGAVSADAATIQTAIGTFSQTTSNLPATWTHIATTALLTSSNAMAQQISNLSNDLSNDLTWDSQNEPNYVNFTTSNALSAQLQSAQVGYQNDLLVFRGQVLTLLQTVLGPHIPVSSLIPTAP